MIETNVREISRPPRDAATLFIDTLKTAWTSERLYPPVLCPQWHGRTEHLLTEKWGALPPVAKKSIQVLATLGQAYPNCPTLETLTRSVVKAGEVKPEKLIKLFERFQKKARQLGTAKILERSALLAAAVPAIDSMHIHSDEKELLFKILAVTPPLIFATVNNSENDSKPYDVSDEDAERLTRAIYRSLNEGVTTEDRQRMVREDLDNFDRNQRNRDK